MWSPNIKWGEQAYRGFCGQAGETTERWSEPTEWEWGAGSPEWTRQSTRIAKVRMSGMVLVGWERTDLGEREKGEGEGGDL